MIADALPAVIVALICWLIGYCVLQLRLWRDDALRHEREMASLRIQADGEAAAQLLAQSRQDNPPVLELEARRAEAEASKARADVEYQQVIDRAARRRH